MKNAILIFLIFFLGTTYGQSSRISGTVFLDENANGLLDTSEKPLRNILVSNGKDLVKTNRKGKYTLSAEKGTTVFPVLPAGYRFSNEDSWWFLYHPETSTQKNNQAVNFGLVPSPPKENFKALIIGDLQVEDQAELGYADRSVLAELRKRKDYDFSIFLGDLVNDEPDMFPSVKAMLGDLEKPSWSVYGNHDRNSDQPHQYQHLDYSTHFGPTTYAFFQGDVLFVVLNTIEPVGKYGYDGNYAASDLEFLEELLKKTPKDQLLVISQHIPLVMMENKQRMLKLLGDRERVLLLSGHTHTVFQNFRSTEEGTQIHELTAGAVSGHWWTGEKDWQGVPLALMQCGTPRGYFEIDFAQKDEETSYDVTFKGVGLEPAHQLSLWFGKPGPEVSRTLSKADPQFLANIYAGSDRSEVRFRVDEGEWKVMEKTRMIDPFIARIKELQDEKLYPDQVSKRSPYLSRSSSHIWGAQVPSDLEPGLHKLEVWAKDEMGLDHTEKAWFWFQEQ